MSLFCATATATFTCPPPQPCYHESSGWPYCATEYCFLGQKCCNGRCLPNCNGECCGPGCCNLDLCQRCVGNDHCVVCNNDSTKFCCNGNCCTNGNCCVNGQCSSTCYGFVWISGSDRTCPACSGGGCTGTAEHRDGYYEWQEASSGFCKSPTKKQIIGHVFTCTNDWDVAKLLECAAEATLCADICRNAHDRLGYAACAACISLAGIACALDPCHLMTECYAWSDPQSPAVPIEVDVVDTGGDWGGVCYH
jgi:hypothetical protein